MYLEFFGLKENPFNLVSDPRFMYYSESHCDAMSHLLYGVRERKGILMMLGEAGTGKTTLVRATLEMLRSTRVSASVIMNPILSQTEEFFDAILRGFHLEGYKRNNLDMAEVLHRFLVQQDTKGRIPVLIVDEAQELSKPLLEQIRMLSNLEHDGHKLLQVVLAAQPEMNDKLESYEMRALRQRITVRCRLKTLGAEETFQYLHSRLSAAGGDGREIFTPESVEAVYAYSGGIPRLINSIADNCLLAAYARSKSVIDRRIVEQIAEHLELQIAVSNSEERASIHTDVLRASSTWKEVAQDIKAGQAPLPLKKFVENLSTPDQTISASRMATAVVGKGE